MSESNFLKAFCYDAYARENAVFFPPIGSVYIMRAFSEYLAKEICFCLRIRNSRVLSVTKRLKYYGILSNFRNITGTG